MNKRDPKTFTHEQLANWLNQGLDAASIGFAVFNGKGETIYENSHFSDIMKKHSRYNLCGPGLEQPDGNDLHENIVQIGKQEWIKIIRRYFHDNTSICTCINLTDQKMAEFTGSENEKKYRLLADNTLDVIWLMDMTMTFIYVNPSVEQMLGYSDREWIGTKLSDHCTAEEMGRMSGIVGQSLERADNKPWVLFETEILSKNHTPVPVEILAKFLFDKNGTITGIQGTTRDIRERKESESYRDELEMLLIQTQKFEALGALAGGIAHDFNNILSAVIGYSELALAEMPEKNELRENIGEVKIAGMRAKELVSQILSFSRNKEIELQSVQINRIAREAIKLLKATLPKNIKIEEKIQHNTSVLADPVHIHQIIMNLCTNASYAMQEKGGTLGIEIRRINIDMNVINRPKDLTGGDYVMLSISDTGEGIPDLIIGKIFDSFFTTKPEGEGSGIGLTVIKRIVNRLNGSIEVDSSPGKGTVFTVYIPSADEMETVSIEPDTMLVGGKERIMVLDDEPSILAMSEQMLRKMGYQVTTFDDSEKVMEWFAAGGSDFDLVVSNVMMPGPSVEELVTLMKGINPVIPIVLCSGYSDEISIGKISELGIKAFLKKPFTMRELVQTVRGVLDGKNFR